MAKNNSDWITLLLDPGVAPWIAGAVAIIVAIITNFFTRKKDLELKRLEHEFKIILKFSTDVSPKEAANNLKFYQEIGFLTINPEVLEKYTKEKEVPVITQEVISDEPQNPIEQSVKVVEELQQQGQISTKPSMSYQVIANILTSTSGTPIPVVPSESIGGDLSDLKFIVLHYTAGPSAKTAINMLTQKKYKVSAHIVIDRDGSITQLIPFDIIAWHAGKSSWKNNKWLNKSSIGIELVNAGRVQEKENGDITSWWGKNYPTEETAKLIHPNEDTPSIWHKYTDAQISSTISVITALKQAYPSIEEVLGHSDITGGRKEDPGPAFPMEKVRKAFTEE